MNERVQIPAYTDRWMMGDRYGVVTKVVRKSSKEWANYRSAGMTGVEIAYVKLDVSGKTIKVIFDDCTVVS